VEKEKISAIKRNREWEVRSGEWGAAGLKSKNTEAQRSQRGV